MTIVEQVEEIEARLRAYVNVADKAAYMYFKIETNPKFSQTAIDIVKAVIGRAIVER